ncbi:MAG: peptidoglycan DD-metalloendopeptidase family protein [Candidatus Latescibacterota bacterium]|nr:MAG: peptidoglycan DD-metalloendopeptidase family protein [Candidatus Latescibacterota bacterium]
MNKLLPILIILCAIGIYAAMEMRTAPSPVGGGWSIRPEMAGQLVADATDGANRDRGAVRVMGASIEPVVVEGEISRGTPFFVEMKRAGVEPNEIQKIVSATKDEFNFRKVKPGQKYSIFSDPDGDLDSLQFVVDTEKVLKITRIGEDYQTRLDTIPYRIEYYLTSGTINESIFATLQNIGADPELAAYLAVIFQWDIDFFKDIRKGDTFSILYEQKIFDNKKEQLGRILAARVFTQGQEHYAIRHDLRKGVPTYFDENGKSLQKSLLRAPLQFSRISSSFSYRRLHPVHKTYKPHLGIDYAAPHGTPVRTTGNGTVVAVTRNSSNGNYVKIRHNSRITTYYLHLSRFARGIRSGVKVKQGQIIGYVGSTGIATGPHLDYRIKVGGKFVNPRRIKLPPKAPVPADQFALFQTKKAACLLKFFEASAMEQTAVVDKPSHVPHERAEILF